jgi:uncharacterized membrane protein YebE (DUF533 family)
MLDPKSMLANVDANGLVGKLLGGMATKNFAAGLLAGGLGTTMLRKGAVENLAKAGGLALLGTLAYQAYGNYQQQKAAGGRPTMKGAVSESAQGMMSQAGSLLSGILGGAPSQTVPATAQTLPEAGSDLALAVIRAMIGAGKADGHMDAAESEKIIGRLEQAGLSSRERALLMQEMANTPDIMSIAAGSRTPQEAAEIYLAALLVCDSQCEREQQYLANLAEALKLEPAFTASLQQELLAINQGVGVKRA